ncbi:MAG: Rieske (2Fe-2S) protein [Candidatus Hydrogenedentes bacterium]|nr:Rieske (2Fe-2S) protein [Candidatus Hydrogenedentota bacterium]
MAPSGGTRRCFFVQAGALFFGGVAALVPAAVGVIAFLNPLRQKGQAGGFIKAGPLAAVPEDGTPRRFALIADRIDAWNRFANEPIGAVYLRRLPAGQLQALQAICPHAGCSINYEGAAQGGKFFCPCHGASFDLAGQRTDSTSPSPRDMDALEVEIRNGGEVWVKFQNFRTGTSKKVAQA